MVCRKSGGGGCFGDIHAHLQDLQGRVPPHGYFLVPTKIIFFVAPWNVARPEAFFRGMGLKVVAVSRCLGTFIGDQGAETTCLKEKVEVWSVSVRTLSGVD